MRYTFTGKNINVRDSLKERTEQKLGRLSRLLSEDAEIYVTYSKIRHQFKVEVSIPLHKRLLRAEVVDSDEFACLDKLADILEKQIVKYKSRLRERKRRDMTVYPEELPFMDDNTAEDEVVIHRTKRFAIKPMDPQEAVMEMELLGHSFFVFRSASTDEVNVVYKRNDGEYGLIEPQ